MNEAKRGKFIVFEGLDGAGKTSCIDILKKELPKEVLFVRSSEGTKLSELIRAIAKGEAIDPLTQLLLFSANRREHMRNTIIPALKKGVTVIADRFIGSTYAYQIVGGDLVAHEKLFWDIHEAVLEGFTPDHYFFVTITPEQARERMLKRPSMDHFEKDMAFQAKVREGYEAFMKKVPHTNIDGGVELSVMQTEAVRLVGCLMK